MGVRFRWYSEMLVLKRILDESTSLLRDVKVYWKVDEDIQDRLINQAHEFICSWSKWRDVVVESEWVMYG
jgi:hypothetical protein